MHVTVSGVAPRRAAGFTLIEILVVVHHRYPRGHRCAEDHGPHRRRAIAKARQDIRVYETALNLFRMDNYKYPTTDQGLTAFVQQPADPGIRNWKQGGYIDSMKKDPWGYDYQYVYPGTHGTEYDLFTLGADNQPGGEGINADIGNWSLN